jgi:hypothetical protein
MVENSSIEHLANEISALSVTLQDLVSVRVKPFEEIEKGLAEHLESRTPHLPGPMTLRRHDLIDQIPELARKVEAMHTLIVQPGQPSILTRLKVLEEYVVRTMPEILTAWEIIVAARSENLSKKGTMSDETE